jgi:glycerol-3-phosphate dehydrogenase subunit C
MCNQACPTGVRIAEINARARAVLVEQGHFSPRLRLRNNLIARAEMLGKFGLPLAPLANAFLANRFFRIALEKVLSIHRSAPLPAFARTSFTDWFRQHPSPECSNGKVVYYHGCSTQYYEPEIGQAVVKVLEKNGIQVIVPPQNCCGLPLLSNGEFKAAWKYHQANVRSLAVYARQGIRIVGASTSCTLTLKEEAPELLDMVDSDTSLVAEQVDDINEFLLSLWQQDRLSLDLRPIDLTIPYHIPCQYKAHRLGFPGLELLKCIPGLKLVPTDSDCCGIAGTYGYKTEKFSIAQKIGSSLFAVVKESSAPFVICDSETCRWQIQANTGLPAFHPIEILAASYGLITIEEPSMAIRK